MPEHGKGPRADAGSSSVEMEERHRLPAIGHDFIEACLRRQPVAGTGHVNARRGEGRHQEMHHPSIEQKPEAAVDGDEDRGVGRSPRCGKKIDPVARVRTVSEVDPRAVGYLAAFLP